MGLRSWSWVHLVLAIASYWVVLIAGWLLYTARPSDAAGLRAIASRHHAAGELGHFAGKKSSPIRARPVDFLGEDRMSSTQEQAEIERELKRIGIQPDDRLPLPQGLNGGPDYVAFLRQVPDGSGVKGFIAAMGRRSEGAKRT